MKIDKTKIKKILFISLSNIGDIVLTTPAIKALSENFPRARMDILVGPDGAELFKKHPAIFKVITYDKHISMGNKRRLINKLRGARYDLIADMRNSLFPLLVGTKYRTSFIQLPPKHVKHKKQQHLWKLSSIGVDIKDMPFYLHLPKEDEDYAERIIADLGKDKPIVAVSPGAKSDIKRWPVEYYAELTDRLIKELGARIIMVGDSQDSSLIRDMIIPHVDNIVDLSGRTTLCQLASLLKRCNLLITNDSAPLHIAGAVGINVLAIFGPTDPGTYGPTGKKDRIARKDLPCSPCEKAQCDFAHECMRHIKADEIFDAAKEMLDSR